MEKPISDSPRKIQKTPVVPKITEFKDLPSCVVAEILRRLPIGSLFACRCVCKDWGGLFSDPLFLKSQIARSPTCILNRWQFSDGRFGFGWVVEEGDDLEIESIRFDSGLHFPFPEDDCEVACVNSCNGLVCLEEEMRGYGLICCLCNPMLRECVTIPLPQRDRVDLSKLALGYSAKNNQYKVLHCFSFKDEDHAAEIYTLGTGQWRPIEVNPTCALIEENDLGFNTFLESRCHWTRTIFLVCCFDFEIEEFKTFGLPPQQTENDEMEVVLGVLNGCLCASFSQEKQSHCIDADIWIMMEYGVESSWTPLLAIRSGHDSPSVLINSTEVVSYARSTEDIVLFFSLSDKEILVFTSKDNDDGPIVCFNTKERKSRDADMLQPQELYNINAAIAYNPSFVSLKDVAEVEEVTVSRTPVQESVKLTRLWSL